MGEPSRSSLGSLEGGEQGEREVGWDRLRCGRTLTLQDVEESQVALLLLVLRHHPVAGRRVTEVHTYVLKFPLCLLSLPEWLRETSFKNTAHGLSDN